MKFRYVCRDDSISLILSTDEDISVGNCDVVINEGLALTLTNALVTASPFGDLARQTYSPES